MENVNKLTLEQGTIPEVLLQISSPPKQLYVAGRSLAEILGAPRITIVGSRKVSLYDSAVTTKLAYDLATRGITIISGLALGVDGLAHKAALKAGGITSSCTAPPWSKYIQRRIGNLRSRYSIRRDDR